MRTLFIIASMLAVAQAARPIDVVPAANAVEIVSDKEMTPAVDMWTKERAPGAPGFLCEQCVNAFEDGVHKLINLVLGGVISGSCMEICSYLPQNLPPSVMQVCGMGCLLVGEMEFLKLVNKADLDPFLFCNVIEMCPMVDGGAASLNKLTINPEKVRIGEPLTIEVDYAVTAEIGAGELYVGIEVPELGGMGTGLIHTEVKPGDSYKNSVKLRLQDSEDQPPFPRGIYNVTVALCQDNCGEHHQHSETYFEAHGSFEVVR